MKLKIAKIIAGGLGWALAGPIGAFFGFIVGSVIDEYKNLNQIGTDSSNFDRKKTYSGDFNISLAILSAAVMKADGRILKSELNFIKSHLNKTVGEELAKELLLIIKASIEKEIPLREVSEQIRKNMNYPERVLLLQYLFGIANSDEHLDAVEADIIYLISRYLRVSKEDYSRLAAMQGRSRTKYKSSSRKDPGSKYERSKRQKQSRSESKSSRPTTKAVADPYAVLGISRAANEAEIKKAYRTLVKKYHPDKVAHLGEEHMKIAKEKFQKIQEAYDKICKSKGIN